MIVLFPLQNNARNGGADLSLLLVFNSICVRIYKKLSRCARGDTHAANVKSCSGETEVRGREKNLFGFVFYYFKKHLLHVSA